MRKWLWRQLFGGSSSELDVPSPQEAARLSAPTIHLPPPTAHYVPEGSAVRDIIKALKARRIASIVGVGGMGGIGKTEAAKIAGWILLRDGRFKDGVCFVDLRGFDETGAPECALSALRLLLRQVGVETGAPPEGANEAAMTAALSAERTRATQGKDLLVVIDNVRDSKAAEPLLPGADGPAVVLTGREAVALPQLERVDVALLNEPRGARLARNLAPRMTEDEGRRLTRIAEGLPLVIETVAGQIEDLPGEPVAALGEEDAAAFAALFLFPAGFHRRSAQAVWGVEDQTTTLLARLRRRNLLLDAEMAFAERLGARHRLNDLLCGMTP